MPSPLPQIRDFLAAHSTMTLATVNPNGQPEASSLFYATDDDTLIWVSGQRSRHSLNLTANGRAAITVHNETWDWTDIAGLQLEGDASLIPLGLGRERAWEVYKTKFPFVEEFVDEISRSEFYRFVPRWIRLIDNSVRFGYREELEFPPSSPSPFQAEGLGRE